MKKNLTGFCAMIAAVAVATVPSLVRAADAKETVRVGHNDWIGYVGYYVAQQAGYFDEAGIKVEDKTFSSPGDSLVPLMNGDLDVALTTVDSVVVRLDKSPDSMKIDYMFDTSAGADAVVASKDIKTAADLKGRKVGVTVGECNEILLIKALESAKMTEDDIKIANMDADAAGAALKAGSIDAAVTWEPWITQLAGEKGGNVIFSSKQIPNVILDCGAVKTGLSGAKAEAVRKFYVAVQKGTQLALDHPDKAADLVGAKLGLSKEDVISMLTKVKLFNHAENVALLEGGIQPAAMTVRDFFASKGVVSSTLDVKDAFDVSSVK